MCCIGKNFVFTFGLKAHHSFDHREAGFNLLGHRSSSLVLSGFDGHQAAIAYTSVDALLQEVGDAIELGGCPSCELLEGSGRCQVETNRIQLC